MTTSPNMPATPRPRHFIHRSDGSITALIAVDELPSTFRLADVPAQLSQAETLGMTSLGVEERSTRVYAVIDTGSSCASVIAPSVQTGSDKTECPPNRVAASVVDGSSASIADSSITVDQSGSHPAANPVEEWRNSIGKVSESQVTIDPALAGQSDNGNSNTTNQRYNPTNPGIFRRKVYCTHWIRTGECDFTQQGCAFKHIMPDLDVLASLGYRDFPRWFREQNGMPAPMHDRRTAAHAPFARFNPPPVPGSMAPQAWPATAPYGPTPVPSAYPSAGDGRTEPPPGASGFPWSNTPPTPAYGRQNRVFSQSKNWSVAGTGAASRASTPFGGQSQVYPPRMTYQQFMANPRRFPTPVPSNAGSPVAAPAVSRPAPQFKSGSGQPIRQILTRPSGPASATPTVSGAPTQGTTTNQGTTSITHPLPIRPSVGQTPSKDPSTTGKEKSGSHGHGKATDKLSGYETLTPQPHTRYNPSAATYQPRPTVAAPRGLFDGAPPAPEVKHTRRFVAPDTLVETTKAARISSDSNEQQKAAESGDTAAATPVTPTGPRAGKGGKNTNYHGSSSANRALANVANAVAGASGGHRAHGNNGHGNGNVVVHHSRKHKKSSPPRPRRDKAAKEEGGILVDLQEAT